MHMPRKLQIGTFSIIVLAAFTIESYNLLSGAKPHLISWLPVIAHLIDLDLFITGHR